MPLDSPYYADAEAVARTLGQDIHLIVPDGQARARGDDGVIAAADPWVLTSATVDFAAQGVAPGDLVLLSASPTDAGKAFKARLREKEPMIAVTAAGHALTLRHVGMESGAGQPPGLGGDLTAVRFLVPDLRPQLGAQSRAVRRDLAHDGTGDAADATDLEDLAIARLAWFTYEQKSTPAAPTGTGGGDFQSKAKFWADYYRSLREGLSGRGPESEGGGAGAGSARPVLGRMRVVPVGRGRRGPAW